MHLHDVQAYRESKEMYQRYKTQLFLVIIFIALLRLYFLLGASNGTYVACFLFIGSILAYIFAYFGYNLLATHVLICSGFIFQFSVPFFTENATFRAFLSTLPIAVSIFTLPDSLYHMLTWYFITSSAGVYMYFVYDPDRDIPYVAETEIERAKRIKVEFATYQTLLLATLAFGLFLYSRVQSYVKRMSAIMMEIEKAGREAEAGVRAKDFLATMSHEIRTPLHGVLGMAQILNSSILSSEQHEYVGEIIVLANNLISMVTNILDLSRVEADLYVLEPQSISVEALLNSLMCVVTRSVPGKSIGMNCVISAGVPRNVILDSKRVLEIMFPIIASHFNGNFDVTIQADHVLSSPVLIINIANSEDQAAQTWQAIISAYIFLCSKGIVNKFRRRPSLLASTLSLLQAISYRAKANHISSDHAGLSVALCLRILTLMHGSLSIDPKQPTNIKLSIPYSPDLTLSEKYEKDEVMNSCSCNNLAEHEHDPHEYQHAKLRYHVATCSNLLNNVLKLDSSSLLPTLRPHRDINADDFIFDSSTGQYQYRWLMCIVCLGIMIAISTYFIDGPNTLFYGSLTQLAVTTMATLSIRNHPEFSIHLILIFSGLTQQVSALYYDNHMLRSWSAILPYIVSIFTVPKFKVSLITYTIGVITVFAFMFLWYDVNYPPANFVGTKEQLWDRVVMDCFILALIATSFATFSYFSLSGILHLKQNIDTHLETLISSKRAAEAGRRAGTFLSIVSHNIRTPLHSLLGATQLLSNMDMSPDQRDCVLQIQSCGNILMGLVTSVLNSTQMDTGMFVLELQPLQLQEIVQSTLDVISVLANQKGIQLSGTIQQGVPKYVMGDRKYLLQILLNITGNAVKFTSKGKVTIEIKVETHTDISRSPSTSRPRPSSSLSPSSSPSSSIPHINLNSSQSESSLSPSLPSSHSASLQASNRLLLMVHDTGPGMDESTQAQLFQPYMQGDQSNSQSQSGSGLGLAICNRLAALMQGDIGMSSSPGKGSSFWMAIPLVPVVTTEEESPEFLEPVILDNSTYRPPNLQNNSSNNNASDNSSRDNNSTDNTSRDNNISRDNNNKDINNKNKGIRHRNSVKPFSAEVIPITTIPIRILIVDDNALNLKVATRALSRIKSAHIDVATNGMEAIEKITNGTGKLTGPVPYTTIFMDVQMPVMDGIEATKKIRMLEIGHPPVYIVGLSAHAEMETQRCLEAGMNQFVGKPFPVDDLISAVLLPLNNNQNNNNNINNNTRSSKME